MILLITGFFSALLLGTIGMLFLAITLIIFIIFHQRRVILYQLKMQQMEAEQQKVLLRASIELQEEERQRIAADLHDDAGPLLATARLYLSDSIVNLDKRTQLQTVLSIKEIIDEAIQLIRNISHSLMPPTLKEFGLESAVNDFFQKINASGSLEAKCCFNNYQTRLKTEKELIIFRIIQELINNILKHSNSTFIHLFEDNNANKISISLIHDGRGLTHEEFLEKSKSSIGLGLKNIQSRLKVIFGDIYFQHQQTEVFYKVTIDVPKDDDEP
jgi:two-component system, NarL family, sensor kinase